ncbi:unnamed protein product [Clavelina lepadiformis]|uniref:Uncharacterized protein n=1 Tax=Clavelina lepadiformis TaxID=159417 RepID=A0ABP0G1A1_CLALP
MLQIDDVSRACLKFLELGFRLFGVPINEINQDWLYTAYVEWTKYDLVNCSAHFPDLFAKINLNFVSNKLLDDVISNEKLVIENCQCSKIL